MPVRTDVHVTGRVDPGTPECPSDIPVRIYRQFGTGMGRDGRRPARPPAIVCFHGGGWVVGDLDSHDSSCRLLAAASGCLVVVRRLPAGPRAPVPGGRGRRPGRLRLGAAAHRRARLSTPGQVGVMGDSAGGNLAAVVALEPGPGARGPVRRARPGGAGSGLSGPRRPPRHRLARTHGDGFFLTTAETWSGSALLPARPFGLGRTSGPRRCWPTTTGVSPRPWWSPRASTHSGTTGALRRGARAAGVEVEYRCYDDQVHGFIGMGILSDSLALATEVCDAMGRLIRRRWAPGPT